MVIGVGLAKLNVAKKDDCLQSHPRELGMSQIGQEFDRTLGEGKWR